MLLLLILSHLLLQHLLLLLLLLEILLPLVCDWLFVVLTLWWLVKAAWVDVLPLIIVEILIVLDRSIIVLLWSDIIVNWCVYVYVLDLVILLFRELIIDLPINRYVVSKITRFLDINTSLSFWLRILNLKLVFALKQLVFSGIYVRVFVIILSNFGALKVFIL